MKEEEEHKGLYCWKQTSIHAHLFRTNVAKPQNSLKTIQLVSKQIYNKTDKHQSPIFEEPVDVISPFV